MQWSWKARVAFVLALLSTSVAAASTASLTEAEAIRLFLEQSPQVRRVNLAGQSVDAALRVEARIANPEVAYQIEDAAGVRDEFLTFQQELPITGRRGLLDQRAEIASAAAGLAAEGELRTDVYDLKRAFHEVLYHERVLQRLREGVEQLRRTVETLQRRESEGEGAGYDALRAEQELAEMQIVVLEAEADLTGSRSRFGSFYDPVLGMESVRLDGDLVPVGRLPNVERAVERALAQRLDLRSLSAELERLKLERRAASRRRFPEPTLMAGWKRVEALGLSDTGYVASLSVPLPIFDRGGFDSARATFQGERVEFELEVLARRIRAEVQAAVARERSARQAAQIYDEQFEQRAGELHGIALLSYEEGESGILELLDAQRTYVTMHLRALAARFDARSAAIDRDRAIGNEVKP